jgi:hypothetical protein
MNPKPRICRSRSFLKTLHIAPQLAAHHDSWSPPAPEWHRAQRSCGHYTTSYFPSLRGSLYIGVTQHIRCERVKGCGAKTMCCRRAVVLDGWADSLYTVYHYQRINWRRKKERNKERKKERKGQAANIRTKLTQLPSLPTPTRGTTYDRTRAQYRPRRPSSKK